MRLKIISPEKVLYDGEAALVKVPGTLGEFEILENHAPIISALQPGVVEYETGGQRHNCNIQGGFAEVHDNIVSLCVEV